VLEEPFAAHVPAEQLFLEWASRPIGERRLARVEGRFVEVRHSREDREPRIGGRIPRTLRFLVRPPNELEEL
jgi:hypothetical protein